MREVIRSLVVWNPTAGREVMLPPGTILTQCQIRRQREMGGQGVIEPYTMEFEFAGQRFSCPLFVFQPRTGPVNPSGGTATGF